MYVCVINDCHIIKSSQVEKNTKETGIITSEAETVGQIEREGDRKA